MTLVVLAFLAAAVLTLYLVLDAVARAMGRPDPDLNARGGWSHETSCGNPGCRSHRR